MDSSEGFAAGPAIGAAASEDGRDDSDASAQSPVASNPDWVCQAAWPNQDLVAEILQIYSDLVIICDQAAAGDCQRDQRTARKLRFDALQLLALARLQAKAAAA